MKSSGTAFDSLFEAYENMRDRSEITAEIEEEARRFIENGKPYGEWERLAKQQGVGDEVSALCPPLDPKGYRDALQWVIGGGDV